MEISQHGEMMEDVQKLNMDLDVSGVLVLPRYLSSHAAEDK